MTYLTSEDLRISGTLPLLSPAALAAESPLDKAGADLRRADDLIGRIEQHEAVHLAGEADGLDVLALGAGGLRAGADGLAAAVRHRARRDQ